MRIAVIGGTGLIGAKLVTTLRHRGHDVVMAQATCIGTQAPRPPRARKILSLNR